MHSSTMGRQQESSGQLRTPRAGERGLCPLLYPSARHRYPEPPPNLTASTHPSHHLLSLRGGGRGVERTLVNSELQRFAINQAFFTQAHG